MTILDPVLTPVEEPQIQKVQSDVAPPRVLILPYVCPVSGSKTVQSIQVAEVATSPQDDQETDKVYETFLKLAGEDKEVDWKELKEILDYSMSAGQ